MKKKKIAHPLHTSVGKEFENFLKSRPKLQLLLDPACNPNPERGQNIPFFLDDTLPKRAVWFTNVDIMVTEGNHIKLVCEIDESNVKPGHIFGKFLSLVSTNICILNNGEKYYFDKKLVFVQVLSNEFLKTLKNKNNSQKEKQWEHIKNSIEANFKSFKEIKSIDYHVLTGNSDNFEESDLRTILKNL